MMEAMSSNSTHWNNKKDGVIDIMVHIAKQIFVKGVINEEIRQVVKPLMTI